MSDESSKPVEPPAAASVRAGDDPMCPPHYRCRAQAGRVVYVRQDVRDDQLETLLRHPGEPLKSSPKAVVRRVGPWVVKESASGSGLSALKYSLMRERYRRAWLASHYLRQCRVHVPEPLVFIEKKRLGLVTGNLFISQYLEGFRNVEEFLLTLVKFGAGPDALTGFLERLADAVNGIALAGAFHADLSGKNIYTRDGNVFYFIDLDAVSLDGDYGEDRRMKNHIQLYDSFCDALNDTLLVPFIARMTTPAQDMRVWMPRVRQEQELRRTRIEAKWEQQGVKPRRIRDDLHGV